MIIYCIKIIYISRCLYGFFCILNQVVKENRSIFVKVGRSMGSLMFGFSFLSSFKKGLNCCDQNRVVMRNVLFFRDGFIDCLGVKEEFIMYV